MSDTHVIAKLPLRVYTPIPDLQYNESVADDMREIPDFLNVNVGEMKNLAPVVCQVHEPHESLRLVPWVKPTVAAEVDGEEETKPEIERGVWQWLNGRWIGMIPEYETLDAIEDEVDVAVADIDDYETSVDAYKALVTAAKDDTSNLYDDCVTQNAGTLITLARTRQLAINQNFLYGTDEAVIPAGQGVTIPSGEGYVAPHATIVFTKSTAPYLNVRDASKYCTYCLPAMIMGGGEEPVASKVVNQYYPGGVPITYYPTFDQWHYYRELWQWWGASKYPDIAFPEYTEDEWEQNFGYYCPANGVGYRDPCVTIEFAWDQPSGDTHPAIYSWPLVQPYYEMITPDPFEHWVVKGFKIWFSNLDYSAWPAAPSQPMQEERKLLFHWAVYGKRRTPPEIWT